MKNVLRVLVIALLLVFLCCPSGFGAEFRLKSGDSVTGDLMSYDGTTFRVKSKFGVLSIEASELGVIGINSEEGIVDIVLGTPTSDDRDRIKGTIEYVREGEVKIKTEYGYVVVNPLDKATGIFSSEAETGKMAKPGGSVASKENLFEGKEFSHEYLTQRVIDVATTENGEVKIAVLHINNFDESRSTRLEEPEQYTYIVDNDGEKYPYSAAEGISTDKFDFPSKVPVKLWFSFKKGKTEKPITTITLFSRIQVFIPYSWTTVDVVIPEIPLP